MSEINHSGGEILSAQHPDCILAEITDTFEGVTHEDIAATRSAAPTESGWCATQVCKLTPDSLFALGTLSLEDAIQQMPENCVTRNPNWHDFLAKPIEVK